MNTKIEGRTIWLLGIVTLSMMFDQIIKLIVTIYASKMPIVIIKNVLRLNYCQNRGGAFSIGEGNVQLIIVLNIIIIGALIIFYKKNKDAEPIRIFVNNNIDNLTTLVSRFHSNETEQNMIKKHSDVIKFQRKVGSSIKGCVIAKGEAEMSYRFSSNTKEWDTCAMQAIVENAGGFVLKFDGTPIKYNREDVYNKDGYIIVNNKKNFLM